MYNTISPLRSYVGGLFLRNLAADVEGRVCAVLDTNGGSGSVCVGGGVR